jgi:WhiB family redox-sensing transcriptional regulator
MTVPDLPLSRSPWPGEWYQGGGCRTVPTEVFFPTRGEDLEPARAVCRACPVQYDCADYAIPLTGLLGVWGGMSEKERRLARRARRRSQPPHDRDHEPGDGDDPEEEAEHRPVERAAPPGSLLATLTDLTAYPEAWAIVVHYRSRNSAWSTASLLRTGRRPSPPGGSWEFEGRVSDHGGSDLWARFTPDPVAGAGAAELVDADGEGVSR